MRMIGHPPIHARYAPMIRTGEHGHDFDHDHRHGDHLNHHHDLESHNRKPEYERRNVMSRRRSRLKDLREAKDRRAKKMAIGGAVVLAALLAFELPHYLGGSKSSPTAAGTTTASSTPGATTPGATTTPGTTAAGSAATALSLPATASTKLPNSDVAPVRTKSQLYSFDTLAGKDPFVQQVSTQTASAASSPAGTAVPTESAYVSAFAISGVSAAVAAVIAVFVTPTRQRRGRVGVAVESA